MIISKIMLFIAKTVVTSSTQRNKNQKNDIQFLKMVGND